MGACLNEALGFSLSVKRFPCNVNGNSLKVAGYQLALQPPRQPSEPRARWASVGALPSQHTSTSPLLPTSPPPPPPPWASVLGDGCCHHLELQDQAAGDTLLGIDRSAVHTVLHCRIAPQ